MVFQYSSECFCGRFIGHIDSVVFFFFIDSISMSDNFIWAFFFCFCLILFRHKCRCDLVGDINGRFILGVDSGANEHLIPHALTSSAAFVCSHPLFARQIPNSESFSFYVFGTKSFTMAWKPFQVFRFAE